VRLLLGFRRFTGFSDFRLNQLVLALAGVPSTKHFLRNAVWAQFSLPELSDRGAMRLACEFKQSRFSLGRSDAEPGAGEKNGPAPFAQDAHVDRHAADNYDTQAGLLWRQIC
jgi:hypothetical protein